MLSFLIENDMLSYSAFDMTILKAQRALHHVCKVISIRVIDNINIRLDIPVKNNGGFLIIEYQLGFRAFDNFCS